MIYPTREAVRQYCTANDLFTKGTTEQFTRMLNMVDIKQPLSNIATVIWFCSGAEKHADEIESDLGGLGEQEETV